MFDLSHVNDYEFELLCKDIMEDRLQTELYSFPKGRDGGIDLCDRAREPEVIVQVKHYVASSYASLLASLKKEAAKLDLDRPFAYYVCTSLGLTKRQMDEICDLFGTHMPDRSHVVDKIAIDAFLSDETNGDILRRHYKLWLCATLVLSLMNNRDVFLDCEELLYDIEQQLSLFVQTTSYFEAIQKLQRNNVIVIVGAPGVGKSTISKMLLLHFAGEEGYAVRYVTTNDIATIKSALSTDPTKREIILLDDFLGQHYLRIRDTQPSELKSLMAYVRRNPHKKLILNSRITILNEARQSSILFNELMEQYKPSEYLIDLDRMPLVEKGKILYNHLYFSGLSEAYFREIKAEKRYLKIIEHKNYNPRIIEYVTRPTYLTSVPVDSYYAFVVSKLDNPADIWRDEFRNRLETIDRVFMSTLYSLTDLRVELGVLEPAFHARAAAHPQIDTTRNAFHDVIKRLNGSLIKLLDHGTQTTISVVNPSVNDFLRSELTGNVAEQMAVIDTATFIEQIVRVSLSAQSRERVVAMIRSGEALSLDSAGDTLSYHYLHAILELEIYDDAITEHVHESFQHIDKLKPTPREYYLLIERLLRAEFIDCYALTDILFDASIMDTVIDALPQVRIAEIAALYIELFAYDDSPGVHRVLNLFREHYVDYIYDRAEEGIKVHLYERAAAKVDDYVDEDGDISEEALIDCLKSDIETVIRQAVDDELEADDYLFDLDASDFDLKYLARLINYHNAITYALEVLGDCKTLRSEPQTYGHTKELEAMFER